MTTVNLKALPGVPVRSYQMTEAEKMDCETGTLDVITGTQIIDSQFRMIILEGLADQGMKFLHEQLQRKGPNDPKAIGCSATTSSASRGGCTLCSRST